MKRWIVITTMMVGGVWIARGAAAERPSPPSVIVSVAPEAATEPAVATPQVDLEIRLIERPRDKAEGLNPSIGGLLTPVETKKMIADLTANPKTKVLAAPRLRTEVGRKASFRSGGEIPREAINPIAGEIPTQVYDFVGTALEATVSISATGSLVINLLCEQSERNRTNKADAVPLNQSRIETRVEQQSGQTVLLSNDRLVSTGAHPVELIVLVTATLVEEPRR